MSETTNNVETVNVNHESNGKPERKPRKSASKPERKPDTSKPETATIDTIERLVSAIGVLLVTAERVATVSYLRAGQMVNNWLTGKARALGEKYSTVIRAQEVNVIKAQLYSNFGLTNDIATLYQCAALVAVLTGESADKLADRIENGDVRCLPYGGLRHLMGAVERNEKEVWNLKDSVLPVKDGLLTVWNDFLAGNEGTRTADDVKVRWDAAQGKKPAQTENKPETAQESKAQEGTATVATAQESKPEGTTATVATESKPEKEATVNGDAPTGNLLKTENPATDNVRKPESAAVAAYNIISKSDDAMVTLYTFAQRYLIDQSDCAAIVEGIAAQEDEDVDTLALLKTLRDNADAAIKERESKGKGKKAS